VIWDKWESLTDRDRAETILQFHEETGGKASLDRVAVAAGLTVPQAYAAGRLPIQVTTALRTSAPVNLQQCHQAMISLGASTLSNPDRPVLRFGTVQEAEECVQQLVKDLPGSDGLWTVTQDVARTVD
jgi:hypothetical protein